MAVVAFFGCLYIVYPGINAYMVVAGRATPGEPIFLDEIALPLSESLSAVAIGVAMVAGALLVRWSIRRKTGVARSREDNHA